MYAHTYERACLRAKNAVYMWPPIAKIMLIYDYYVRSLDCMVCTHIRTYVYVTVMNSIFGQVTCTVWEIVKSREAFFKKKSPSLPLTSLDSLSMCDPLRIHMYMHTSNNAKNLLNLAHILLTLPLCGTSFEQEGDFCVIKFFWRSVSVACSQEFLLGWM